MKNILIIGYSSVSRYILQKNDIYKIYKNIDIISDYIQNIKNIENIQNIYSYKDSSNIDYEKYDFTIVSNKIYQELPTFIKNINDNKIIYLQNGWFDDEISSGVNYSSFYTDDNNNLNIINENIIYVNRKNSHMFFNSIGIKSEYCEKDEFRLKKIEKLLLNLIVNTSSILYNKNNIESYREIPLSMRKDIYTDIEKIYKYFNISHEIDSFEKHIENVGESYSSSLKDYRRNKSTEIPYFFEHIFNFSKKNNISLPHFENLCNLYLNKIYKRTQL